MITFLKAHKKTRALLRAKTRVFYCDYMLSLADDVLLQNTLSYFDHNLPFGSTRC